MGNPLSELGLVVDDKLSIDHAIVLSVTKSVEEALRQTLVAVTKSSREISRLTKVVGYAAATYLVLAGVARVIEASSGRKGGSKSDKP